MVGVHSRVSFLCPQQKVEVDLIDTGDTKLPLQSPLQQAGVTTDVSLGPVLILVPRARFLPSPVRMLHLVAVGLHPILNDSFIHFAHAGLATQKSFSTNKFSLGFVLSLVIFISIYSL